MAIGSVIGYLIAVTISGLVSGILIYTISALGLGLKVKSFGSAAVAGVGIGIISNTFWDFFQNIFSFDPGLMYALMHTLITALAILFIGKVSKKHLEVNGLKGAITAAISIGIIMYLVNSLLGGLMTESNQNVTPMDKSEEKEVSNVSESYQQEENEYSDLKKKLITNIVLTVPGTDEVINMSDDIGEYSLGYVRIGDIVAKLPEGALVTTMEVNTGGNAEDVYLAVFEPGENAWQLADSALLGDYASNAEISSLYTDMETIYVVYYTYSPDMSAQAEEKTVKNEDMFIYVSRVLEMIGGNNEQTSYPILEETSWAWVRTELNDDTTYTPDTEDFVITFNSDGSFSSTSDCNNINGSYGYNAATGQLFFEDMIQTFKLCPDSLEDQYTSDLREVESAMFEDELMYMQLKMDAGTMVFEEIE